MIKELANYLYTEETITGKKFVEICKNLKNNNGVYLSKTPNSDVKFIKKVKKGK